LEVKIGIGLSDVIFGMSIENVEKNLGKPNKISETDKPDGIVFYYNEPMIKVKFDKEFDSKLYSFEVFNPGMEMFGRKIMGKQKSEIEDMLNKLEYLCEYEDYVFFETLFCQKIWTTFAFQFDKLRSIEFSPLIDQNDEIIWPEIK